MPGGGFGENFYKNQQFNGLEEAPDGSVPYPLFLQSLKAKLVERVEFEPPSGDVAYAYMRIDGDDKPATKVRMGQGWPVAVGNSWSDPIWVVRILENEGVPYKFNFDLKMGTASGRSGKVMTKAEEKMRAAEAAKQQGLTAGKWMGFVTPAVADAVWADVARATAEGKLGNLLLGQP